MIMSIDKVKPGFICNENVYEKTKDRILLLSGTVLNLEMISTLKKMKINSIDVISNQETIEKPETINTAWRCTITESLKKLNYTNLMEASSEISFKITHSRNLQYNLSRYINEEDNIYNRAINVCIYATAIGKKYNEKCPNRNYRIDLKEIALAALLFNLGKIAQNEEILKKLEPIKLDRSKFPGFDPECFSRYNDDMHIIYTYSLLRNINYIPQSIRTAILFSQENEKGTGILGVGVELTSRRETSMIISKIIHLCSIYDDLLFKILKKGPLERKESPSNIIEVLSYAKKNGLANEELINLLFKAIPLYPLNTKVKLSDGNIATVVELNRDLTLPTVKIDITEKIINLSTEKNVTISYIENS